MNAHVTDHLSDYLDDELDAAHRAAIDAHLQRCTACAEELNALRRVVAHAATVAEHDAAPARDLWSGIHARIEGRVRSFAAAARQADTKDAAPIAFSARRISLSIAQLAAAAMFLIAVSGTAAWILRGRAPASLAPAGAVIQAEVEPTAPPADVRLVRFADTQYNAAVSDLERALQERRNDLNPHTVEILERNLTLIDAAIAQAQQALEEDPGNTYLNRHLVESRRRKLELLRRATAITEGD
jgi:anti-sigma factor RsiW